MMCSKNQPLSTILFDLDGTISDSKDIIITALWRALLDVTGKDYPREELVPFFGKTSVDVIRHFASGGKEEEFSRVWRRYVKQDYPNIKAFPNIEKAIQELGAAGFNIAVVTSQSHRTLAMSRDILKIEHLIPVWISRDDGATPKPAPDTLLIAVEKFGCEVDEAIMIGDTEFDILAGQAAGMRTAAALWGANDVGQLLAHRPDFVFYHPDELKLLLEMVKPQNKK